MVDAVTEVAAHSGGTAAAADVGALVLSTAASLALPVFIRGASESCGFPVAGHVW